MYLCGPFTNRNVILALIDEYSRWPEVNVFRRDSSTQQVIDHLRKISAVHGIPYKIVADNGPQFRKRNKELKSFCLETGIHFRNVTPYWPRANGEIERFFRTLKKTIQSSNLEGRQWQHDLFDFFLLYRSTTHCSTNESPSSLLMKRNIRNKLPSLEEFLKAIEPKTGTVSFDSKSKAYQIKYNKRYSRKVTINTGDKVLMNQIERNKLSTNFSPEPIKVIQIQGSQVTAKSLNDKKVFTRNMCFFKKLHNFNDNIHKSRPTNGEIDMYYDSFSTTSNVDVQPYVNVQNNTINQNEHVILRGNPPHSCGPPDRLRY